MNKKGIFTLLAFVLSIPFLSGCQNNKNPIDPPSPEDIVPPDVNYSFLDGKAVFSFNKKGYEKFNLYQKEKGKDEYQFVSSLNDNTFTSDDLWMDYKVVALNNDNSENNEYILEIDSYFAGVFHNKSAKVFEENDNHLDIQKYIDDKYEYLAIDEWSNERNEIMFLPGDYSDITLKNGYYTTFKGLGYSPDDAEFEKLWTKNHPNTGNALINFWRSLENLSFNEDSMWAISQATSIRRGHFKSNLVLSDTVGGNGWSSGGFIANSKIDGVINPGSQQQFLMRNDEFESWTHSNMNMVFEGCIGETPEGSWIESRTTVEENNLPVIEKPYLVFDENKGFGYVFNNTIREEKGYDWNQETNEFIPLYDFAVINPTYTAAQINYVLNNNKYVLFTPGIYNIDTTLEVKNDDSIIMGMGYATLSAVGDVKKVMSVKSTGNKICSLLFQNETIIDNFLTLETNDNDKTSLLSDLFFRVGGQSENTTKVGTCLTINQNDVITDHFWIWRADHGKHVGFDKNYGRLGCVINGHRIISHALMVEHFCEYQLMWNGEDGKVIFYQSETPYDIPDQSSWLRYDEGYTGEQAFGYPSYKIDDGVVNHKSYGVGIYYINTMTTYKIAYTGLETPCNDDIYLKHISTRYFGGNGRFMHCINGEDGVDDDPEDYNMTIELFDKETYPELFQSK